MTAIRLRYLAEVNPATPEFDELLADAEVPFLPLEAVWPGARLDVSRRRPKGEVSTGYTRFREGDILVPKITPTFEADRTVLARGLEGGVAAGTTELHIVRPRLGVEPRFLRYLLSSRPFLLGGEASMVGVAGQKRVPENWLKDFPVGVIDLPEQRAIANYLDVETARIDALVAKKRQMIELLQEREFALLSEVVVPEGCAFVKLGFLAALQTGLTVDGQRDPGPDAVRRPYLRVANVQPGWLELDSVTEIEVPRGLADRCTLRHGDVLMTEGGDLDKLGRGTVWAEQLPRALHQNHVFAVRPDPAKLDHEYLGLLTATAHARAYFESTGTRTTNLASTNSSKILDLPVPALGLEEQKALLHKATSELGRLRRVRGALSHQTTLIQEHRQALITAAVMGEVDVPGAAA